MQLPADPVYLSRRQAPSRGFLRSGSSEPSVLEGSPCDSCASKHGLFGSQATLASGRGHAARPVHRSSSASSSSSLTSWLCRIASSSSPAATRRQLSAPVAKRRLLVSRRGLARPLSAAAAASPHRPRGQDGRLMAAAQQKLQQARQSRPVQVPRLCLEHVQLVWFRWQQMLPSVLMPHRKLCKALEQHGCWSCPKAASSIIPAGLARS